MLNMKNDFPFKENLTDALQNRIAQIRDLLLEIEQIQQLQIKTQQEELIYTREQVAEKFHADPRKLPRELTRNSFKVGKQILYKSSDVENFISSRMKRK